MRFRHYVASSAAVCGITLLAGAAWASVFQIDQIGQKFSRSSITVRAGDHLVFTNQDDVNHNIKVVSPGGGEEDKGVQSPGQAMDVAFVQAGAFEVRCRVHPKMLLKVDVQ